MTLFAIFFWYHISWIKQRRAALESGEIFTVSGQRVSAPFLLSLCGEAGYEQVYSLAPSEEQIAAKESRLSALFPEAEIYVDAACPPGSFSDEW